MPQERHLGDPTKGRLLFTQPFEPGRGDVVMSVITER
jgi:hypothetical protein